MKVFEFLEANKASMRFGLPIELQDLIDGRSVYAGSFEVLMNELEKIGLEHVRNARFVMEDTDNGQNRIVLLYMKDLKEYDDFDLRQFAYKMKRLEAREATFEEKLLGASERSEIDNIGCTSKSNVAFGKE